jgi:hypothetical protein
VRGRRAPGLRVVASPAALDVAAWHAAPGDPEPLVLRFAPDDAFGFGAVRVDVGDADAIVEREDGFTAFDFRADAFAARVVPHVEWPVPSGRPTFAQGSIAGVPAKLWLDAAGAATIVVATAYADELADRLR